MAKLFLVADNTNLLQVLFSAVCHQELQSDIDHLIEWSDEWQWKFNTSKCKVMQTGPTNTSSYSMLDLHDHKHKELEFIEKENDLGVIFENNLKFSSHIINQVNKANQIIWLISISNAYLDKNSFRYSFSALVWLHLEYCVSILPKKKKTLVVGDEKNLHPGSRIFFSSMFFEIKIIYSDTHSTMRAGNW